MEEKAYTVSIGTSKGDAGIYRIVTKALCAAGFNKTTDPTAYDVEQRVAKQLPQYKQHKVSPPRHVPQQVAEVPKTAREHAKKALEKYADAEFAVGAYGTRMLINSVLSIVYSVAILDKDGTVYRGDVLQCPASDDSDMAMHKLAGMAADIAATSYEHAGCAQRLFKTETVKRNAA